MNARYELHLYSNTGQYLQPVTRKITRLEYTRKVNDRGPFSLTVQDRLAEDATDIFRLNSRVAIWRKAGPFDPAQLEMVGFVRDWRYKTDDRGVTHYQLAGWDQNDLLYSRVCVPWHDGFWAPYLGNYADTAMRFLFAHNLGTACADSARDVVTSNGAGLTITGEAEATATACTTAGQMGFEHGGKNLLGALQQLAFLSRTFIAQGSTVAVPVYFGVCADTDTTLTFRVRPTRWGLNHRADSGSSVPIGPGYGNLRLAEWSHDRLNEVTAGYGIYAAHSYSTAGWALDQTRIDEAPLNRREAAAPAGEDQSTAVASELLKEGKTKPQFKGIISDTAGCRYGVHWGLGDELSVDNLGKQYNVMVMGVRVICQRGREQVEPTWEVTDDD